MPRIIYIEHDGTRHEVDAEPGANLMSTALDNGVPGIDGDCGGNCACATCHLYLEGEWQSQIGGAASDTEQDMLGFADGATEASRLGCQVKITEAMDGLTVKLPLGQH